MEAPGQGACVPLIAALGTLEAFAALALPRFRAPEGGAHWGSVRFACLGALTIWASRRLQAP